jgi:hypothetical protein
MGAAGHHPLSFLQHSSSYSELLIAMEAAVPAARCYHSSHQVLLQQQQAEKLLRAVS